MKQPTKSNPAAPIVASQYVEPDWVDTPTSTQIHDVLTYAQTTPTIALIYGGAGLGKTITAWRYRDAKNSKFRSSVYLITAHPGISTVASVLSAISAAMGRESDAYRNDAMARQIMRMLNRGDLLIIDEAHNLDTKALDQVRYFHDVAGIGIAYLGNEEIYTRINGRGKQAAFLGPLASRVGMRIHLPQPSTEDVRAYMKGWGIVGAREHNSGHKIAVRNGIRGLGAVLRQGAIYAHSMGCVLDRAVIERSAHNLGFN
jgi:DNA transposition AAA+ family ATPase